MITVRKRDGEFVQFDIAKINDAIEKAFIACNKYYTKDVIELLGLRVVAQFNDKIKDGTISIEDIQDTVETVLIEATYVDVAKAYILYRKQHENIRQVKTTVLDYKNVVDNYLKINDWRVKELIHQLNK